MLAGEPFSDEPGCACPVIAEFLRTYNDQVDDARRQDLFAYAALVVDSRQGPRTERRRANMCLDWWLATSSGRYARVRRLLWMLSPSSAWRDIEIAHRTARWAAAAPERHAGALALVERMTGRSPVRIDAGLAGDRGPAGIDAALGAAGTAAASAADVSTPAFPG